MTGWSWLEHLHFVKSQEFAIAGSAARAAFPRGLLQPEGSYRFGADALLLAAYAASCHISKKLLAGRASPVAVDLGCGCGAAIFAFAFLQFGWQYVGIDNNACLLDAAKANAYRLNLSVNFLNKDLESPDSGLNANQVGGQCQLVMANPPWRKKGTGHLSPRELREQALGNAPADFFCNAAKRLLAHHGLYCCIIPTVSLPALVAALDSNNLGLREILPIVPHKGESAIRLLCLAKKAAVSEPKLLPPLVLHEETGQWTKQAQEFCPWLGNNFSHSQPGR